MRYVAHTTCFCLAVVLDFGPILTDTVSQSHECLSAAAIRDGLVTWVAKHHFSDALPGTVHAVPAASAGTGA